MKMKKKYIKPLIMICGFLEEDVFSTSNKLSKLDILDWDKQLWD